MSLLDHIEGLNRAAKLRPPNAIVPYHSGFVQMIKPRGTDALFFEYVPDFHKVISHYATVGTAFVGVHAGKPKCIFGAIQLWEGVAEIWMITDESLPEYALPFQRSTKAFIDILINELQLVRVQFTVHSQNLLAVKWAKSLYFIEEGIMRKFGPDGADFHIFAKVR
jgi:hypothetical protein